MSSVLWLRDPMFGGIHQESSGYGCLKTQTRVRIRASCYVRSDLLALGPAVPGTDWRMKLRLCQTAYWCPGWPMIVGWHCDPYTFPLI